MVLLSQLYGLVKYLCQGIEEDVILSDDGTDLFIAAIYKSALLSVVSLVY